MSYSWVGAPAVFNGTNAETGGNSGLSLTTTTINRFQELFN